MKVFDILINIIIFVKTYLKYKNYYFYIKNIKKKIKKL